MIKRIQVFVVCLLFLLVNSCLIQGESDEAKIMKVGKYSIDTTKHKPDEKIVVRDEKKVIKINGRKVVKTYIESVMYSVNQEYALIEYGENSYDVGGEAPDYYGDWRIELYKGKPEKKLYKEIIFEPGRAPLQSKFLTNGYLILKTEVFEGHPLMEVYDPDGNYIYKDNFDNRTYDISPNEEFLIIIEQKEYTNIFKLDLNKRQFKNIYKVTEKGQIYFYPSLMISSNGQFILFQNEISNDIIQLLLFYNDKLLWKKQYSRKELAINGDWPIFKLSLNAKYIIYRNGVIDAKSGIIINNNTSKKENEEYKDEKK